MKDNKLIADFMELEVDNGLYCYTTAMDDYKTDTLYFDASWDWLMPVVDRCFDIHLEHSDDLSFLLNDALLTTNIDEVYKAVMEFIKRTKKST